MMVAALMSKQESHDNSLVDSLQHHHTLAPQYTYAAAHSDLHAAPTCVVLLFKLPVAGVTLFRNWEFKLGGGGMGGVGIITNQGSGMIDNSAWDPAPVQRGDPTAGQRYDSFKGEGCHRDIDHDD